MDAKQRDGSKDFDGRAANFGVFNLSVDLAEKTGYFNGGNWAELTFDQWQVRTTASGWAGLRQLAMPAGVGAHLRHTSARLPAVLAH